MLRTFEKQDRVVMRGSLLALFAFLFLAAGEAKAQSFAPWWAGQQGNGNSSSFGAAELPSSQARTALPVVTGKVIDIKSITIDVAARTETRALGAGLGALAGGYAARHDHGAVQGAAAMLLAFAGDKLAQRVSAEQRPAQEVIVLFPNGTAISVVQENDAPLAVGDAVYLLGTSPARVRKAG